MGRELIWEYSTECQQDILFLESLPLSERQKMGLTLKIGNMRVKISGYDDGTVECSRSKYCGNTNCSLLKRRS